MMKMIDLLVQELPKKLGWPEGAIQITQDEEGEICCWKKSGAECVEGCWKHPDGDGLWLYMCNDDAIRRADDRESSIITREQYEVALQASWNGEGLPPVGVECEGFDGVSWFPVVIVGRYDGFAFAWSYDYRKTLTVNEEHSNNFRPIRTEAERKREDLKSAIAELCRQSASNGHSADLIYDAIAAGKIPGVKLEG